MIEFYNVHAQIDDKPILNNISFRLVRGEFAYITGPSGAGKSTILRMVYMDLMPREGMIIIENYSSAKTVQKEIPFLRRRLGVIFQDFKLLTDRNVFDNVAFALRVSGAKSNEIKRRVFKVLAEVNLGNKRDHYPDELSGGEKQRVAIARAIVNNPIIILADEPTGNLDRANAYEIMQILERVNRQGTAVLMATHDEHLIKKYPHRMLRVHNGVMVDK